RDAGDDGAVVGSDPRLRGQGVRDPGPALPLVVERDARVYHRTAVGQEGRVDGRVEAAGRAHPRYVPAALDDLGFGRREEPAPEDRAAVWPAPRLVPVENLEAAEHPGALLAAGAEGPATGDAVAAIDGHGPPATHHGGAGDDGVRATPVDLLDALVRQAERDELADAVVGDVPAGPAGGLGAPLAHPRVRPRSDLQLPPG